MRRLTGGHDLEQTAFVGDASNLAPVAQHGCIVVGRRAPDLHDLAESGGATTGVGERAICSPSGLPAYGGDLVTADLKGRDVGGGSRTQARPRRPSRWSTRAPKSCPGTWSRGIAASPEGHSAGRGNPIPLSWACQRAASTAAAGVKQQLARWIDDDRDKIIEFLCAFVRAKSLNPPGDTTLASAHIARFVGRDPAKGQTVRFEPSMPHIVGSFGKTSPVITSC